MQRRAEQRRVGQWSGCVTTPPEVPTQYRVTDVPQSVSTGTLHWGPLPATRPHCDLCPHVFHLLYLLVQINHWLVLDASCLQGGREGGRETGGLTPLHPWCGMVLLSDQKYTHSDKHAPQAIMQCIWDFWRNIILDLHIGVTVRAHSR